MQQWRLRSIDRRTVVTNALAAFALVAGQRAPLLDPPVVGAQAALALKDAVPDGWLIGVAINQNQSDARDAAAVHLITRQFNSISPENLLKFESVQRQPASSEAQPACACGGVSRGSSDDQGAP